MTLKVGFVGVGDIGNVMARSILKAGIPLSVYDLNKEAVDKVVAEGAAVAGSCKELMETSDAVISMVRDIPQTEEVVFGKDGLWEGTKEGSIIILSSTIGPYYPRELYEKGKEIMEPHSSESPFVVVTGRAYNLYDERLNLRLGQNLAKIGVSGLPMDFIDVSSVDLSDFPSMYWGLGAQILRTAKFIQGRPNYFGLHITNFSCGADSFIEHFYKYIMGDKPYLILELDEHSAVAGVMTRLEAYKNVIENTMQKLNSELYDGLRMAS